MFNVTSLKSRQDITCRKTAGYDLFTLIAHFFIRISHGIIGAVKQPCTVLHEKPRILFWAEARIP